MKIGIFTDTFHPVVNGITYVVDELRQEFIDAGHQVIIVAPAVKLRKGKNARAESGVVRIPAVKDLFYEDQFTSVFFPPLQQRKIKELGLDIILFTTPGQIGMLGVLCALRHETPLSAMYCTDLYEYIRLYPGATFGMLALVMTAPIAIGARAQEIRKIMSQQTFKNDSSQHWTQRMVVEIMTVLHNRCQVVVVPSRKIKKQIQAWGTNAPIEVIPTGISTLETTESEVKTFRSRYKIAADDKVILSVGRLAKEKNIELAIGSFDLVKAQLPQAKLLIVGDGKHREELENLAASTPYPHDIIFTGKIPRKDLGAAYGAADVFVFPSLTDTQGLVLHEAAQSGLPLVICDEEVTEVLKDARNGFLATDDKQDFAGKVAAILSDAEAAAKMGRESRKIVAPYTATNQARKMLSALEVAIKSHSALKNPE